ncbi:MAG: DAK2 domain-containing protein [Clostridiales bacterium]|jgi:hypothetical protein|nr:DAK2 domain-containing protein [Clostridiales bacterium]
MRIDYDLSALRKALVNASVALIESKELLTHIDNLSGDGDLGISMQKAGRSVLRELDKSDEDGIAGLLSRCAVSINLDAPSTMGTLTSFSLMEAAKQMKGKERFSIPDLLRIPFRMVEIIMIRGRAQRGDKTVLDALVPYAEALSEQYLDELDIEKAAAYAAEAAEQAANDTRGHLAKIGRAKWIAERSRDCPDGGAVVCAIVVNAIIGKRIIVSVETKGF